MSLDKVLHKIQGEINELAPTLELFVDDTIQPSVSDCEILQKQLTLLQENVAVYKYQKLNKELSPSFNIHAKVSAQEKTEEKVIAPEPVKIPEIKTPVVEEIIKPEPIVVPPVVETKITEHKPVEPAPVVVEPVVIAPVVEVKQPVTEKTEFLKPKNPVSVGINDKFRFINTLFSQNASEYNIALEQINNLSSWGETEMYLNSLKHLYGWQEDNDAAIYFYSIAKKRFN